MEEGLQFSAGYDLMRLGSEIGVKFLFVIMVFDYCSLPHLVTLKLS